MLGLQDKVGRLEIKALGIRLNRDSSQAQFISALKHRPELKDKQIIELTEAQIKSRAGATVKPNTLKNGNKDTKETTEK